MENEAAQLRRKLSSVREENSSLVLENRQLITDLDAAQLEIASSRSKVGSTKVWFWVFFFFLFL